MVCRKAPFKECFLGGVFEVLRRLAKRLSVSPFFSVLYLEAHG